jgi:hypothetical protein
MNKLETKIEELIKRVQNIEKLLEELTKKNREREEENPIVGGCYINGETICELRENPDLDPEPDTCRICGEIGCESEHCDEMPPEEDI